MQRVLRKFEQSRWYGSETKGLKIESQNNEILQDFHRLFEDVDPEMPIEARMFWESELQKSDYSKRRWVQERSRSNASSEDRNLRQRLNMANSHFRRKASEVLVDKESMYLLADLYQEVSLDLDEIDVGRVGLPLAKLTAAHFCEVGVNVIYITESGQRFIDSLQDV